MPFVHRCPRCKGRDVRSALWVDPNATADDVAASMRFDVKQDRVTDVNKAAFYCRSCDERVTSLVVTEEQATFSITVQVSYDVAVEVQADSIEEAKARATTLQIAHPGNEASAVWTYDPDGGGKICASVEGVAGVLSEPRILAYSNLKVKPWRHQLPLREGGE